MEVEGNCRLHSDNCDRLALLLLHGVPAERAAGMHVLYWPQTEPGGVKPSLSETQGFVPLDSADELKRELAGLLGEVANALAE